MTLQGDSSPAELGGSGTSWQVQMPGSPPWAWRVITQLGRGRRKATAHPLSLTRSLFTQSVPTPAPKTGLWKGLESPARWPPAEARGIEMVSGFPSCTPADGEKTNKQTLLPSQELQSPTAASKEGPARYPASLKAASGGASPPGLLGHLARPPTREDRLSPGCPDRLASFPEQATLLRGLRGWRQLTTAAVWGQELSHQPSPSSTSAGTAASERDPSREERATGPLWPNLFSKSPQ